MLSLFGIPAGSVAGKIGYALLDPAQPFCQLRIAFRQALVAFRQALVAVVKLAIQPEAGPAHEAGDGGGGRQPDRMAFQESGSSIGGGT